MARYDAIIVGAGHNGLISAAYLARAGARVLVLERRSILGGDVTLASLRDRAETAPEITRVSGRQERLENVVARAIDLAR